MHPDCFVPRTEFVKVGQGDVPIDINVEVENDAAQIECLRAAMSEQASRLADLFSEMQQLKQTTSSIEEAQRADSTAVLGKEPISKRVVEKSTFWMESEEKDVNGYTFMMKKPVHVPSHAMCLLIYLSLMVAYSVYSLLVFIESPPETSFSSEEAVEFGPISLSIIVDCSNCNVHKDGTKYKITSNYDGIPHCEQDGSVTIIDKPASSVVFCRSSDDIGKDSKGIDIWIGNISESTLGVPARAIVYVSQGNMKVTTPVERWHEKTLLLGLTVTRDSEDCVSSKKCNLERNAYLASMQYDGKVDWPSGGKVHLRMLRFANVYTIAPSETLADIAARIGGASGLLILVLGGLRKALELLVVGSRKEAAETAITTAGVAAVVIGMGE